jgi:hypothetical protein
MDKPILIKFYTGVLYEKLLSHFSFFLDRIIFSTTLHTAYGFLDVITIGHSPQKEMLQLFQQKIAIIKKKKELTELDGIAVIFVLFR